MRNHTRLLSGLAALAALVVLAGGCIFSPDDDVTNPPVPPSYPFPDSEVVLMENFKTAYDNMNIEEYRNVLHADFKFVFIDGTPVTPTSGYYTREEDLQSTTRMFNHEQGMNNDGEIRAGVRDVDFRYLEKLLDWEDVQDPEFPGAKSALFEVQIVLYLDDEFNSTITVESQQIFYSKSELEVQEDSSTRQRFYLVGQKDLDTH